MDPKSAFRDEISAGDVAIVGLGPGGLAAALSAAASGKQVLAFTDRSQYIRGQRLALNKQTSDFLFQYIAPDDPDDLLFQKKFIQESSAQTKDIERFLYKKLQKYPNAIIVDTSKDASIQSIGNSSDLSASFIALSDGRKFYTRNILAADGARHNFANLMNKDLSAEIQYGKSPVQERHPYHGVVQLQLKFEDSALLHASRNPELLSKDALNDLFQNKNGFILYRNKVFYFDSKNTTEPVLKQLKASQTVKLLPLYRGEKDTVRMATFKEQGIIQRATRTTPAAVAESNSITIARRAMVYMRAGWKEGFEPKDVLLSNVDKTKFYFAGEIPKAIFEEPNEVLRGQKLKEWACLKIEHKFGYKSEQLEYRQSKKTPIKDSLQATVFELNMQVCQTPIVPLCHGVFSQIGDARRTPNYNIGHGVNDAIAGGIAFVSAISPPSAASAASFDSAAYQAVIQTMDTQLEATMEKKPLTEPQKKLLDAIDRLITHLEESKLVSEENLMALRWGRQDIETASNTIKMIEAIELVRPEIMAPQSRDIADLPELAWRCIASSLEQEAIQIKSAILFDEMESLLHPMSPSSP